MSTFLNQMKENIPAENIASKGGLSYLSAASAIQLANFPDATFVDYLDLPYMELFDGAIVAVDINLPGLEDEYGYSKTQRTYLPVMDGTNRCIPMERITVNDISNSRQRCLVKAIATTLGNGMSVFLGKDGDGEASAELMGLEDDSDLRTTEAVVSKLSGGEPYLAWTHALAAARITDSAFLWDVVQWNGKPYREVLGGVLIDIETTYKGVTQRFSFPMMDEAFNPIPVNRASVWLWNRTVMRALSKAIAFHTGYGIDLYSGDFGDFGTEEASSKESSKDATSTSKKGSKAKAAPTKAKASPKPEASAEDRFKGVIRNRLERQGVDGLATLFSALEKSDKYTEEEKPVCFRILVSSLASLINEETEFDPQAIIKAMIKYKAMELYVPEDSKELVASKLIQASLARGVILGDEVLASIPDLLQEAGIVSDLGSLIGIASDSNVPEETIDLLLSLV